MAAMVIVWVGKSKKVRSRVLSDLDLFGTDLLL